MKALLIYLLLVQGLQAAELEKYSGERLEYDLEWNPFWGIITPKAGEASFSCDRLEEHFLTRVQIQTLGWAKTLYAYSNWSNVAFNIAGCVMWSESRLTDSTKVCWRVDQSQGQVYRFRNDTLVGTLALAGKIPLEALSAFYLFRSMNLELGQSLVLEVFGTDNLDQVHWSKAFIEVIGYEVIEWLGDDCFCWVVKIKLPPQDSFIPSGEVIIWVTNDGRKLPLKVKTDILYKGIKLPVIGILKARSQAIKKDEP